MHQYRIWARAPGLECLGQHLYFSFIFILVHMAWGPKIKPQRLYFLLISFLYIFYLLVEGFWDQTPTTHFYFNFFFYSFFELTMRLWDQTPTASFYFSFISPVPPRGRGFDPHTSHLFSSHFS